VINALDHLVYATPDLGRGVDEIEALTGVGASAGGQHPSWGTHNALLALGANSYLEIIAPDPSQPAPAVARPFGIDDLRESRLVTWAARAPGLEQFTRAAAGRGVLLGEVLSGSRVRSDGVLLSWHLTSPWALLEEGTIPFFIDWGLSPHPAASAATGLSLAAFRAEHPSPPVLARAFESLGVDLPIRQAPEAALVATIDSPKGRIELR
jgi:Glyoxalase-like domain